jgi:hypothetical protein
VYAPTGFENAVQIALTARKNALLGLQNCLEKNPEKIHFFDTDRFSDGSAWGAAVFVSISDVETNDRLAENDIGRLRRCRADGRQPCCGEVL